MRTCVILCYSSRTPTPVLKNSTKLKYSFGRIPPDSSHAYTHLCISCSPFIPDGIYVYLLPLKRFQMLEVVNDVRVPPQNFSPCRERVNLHCNLFVLVLITCAAFTRKLGCWARRSRRRRTLWPRKALARGFTDPRVSKDDSKWWTPAWKKTNGHRKPRPKDRKAKRLERKTSGEAKANEHRIPERRGASRSLVISLGCDCAGMAIKLKKRSRLCIMFKRWYTMLRVWTMCMWVLIVCMAVSSINAERNWVFCIIFFYGAPHLFLQRRCQSLYVLLSSTINIEYIDYSDDRFILIHGV